jgi:nucleotidyltransferase/DNA polymerase involved in DNA repair
MFAVIYLPNFCLQAVLRHEPELNAEPVALIDPDLPRPAIGQLTAAARASGVSEGLTASQAMARCEKLISKTRSRREEQTASAVLLQTAYTFSPHLEATGPGLCTVDLKGLAFQSETMEQWAGRIIDALARFHLSARIGIAVTPALALLAARAAKPVAAEVTRRKASQFQQRPPPHVGGYICVLKDTAEFISRLPITALEPSMEILEILRRWGIHTVGALIALGKERVNERLGPEAIALFDRVSSEAIRPLKLSEPTGEFLEEMEFDHEIETVEPLWFVLRRFVEQLSCRLEILGWVVGAFQLRLGLASGARYEHSFRVPAPTGKVDVLFRILQTHLETVRTDSPIISLRLLAEPCRAEAHQFGLFEASLRDPNQFAETVGRLMALCGADRVGTPELDATHRPDAWRLKAPEFGALGSRRGNEAEGLATTSASSHRRLHSDYSTPIGLPLRRFRPAISARIEFCDERPVSFHSPLYNGPVAGVRGPFLSSGDWWEESRWAREEWDVQTADGTLFRIYRCASGSYVEGVYD